MSPARVAAVKVPGGGCMLHPWTTVAATERHQYQACGSCGARRVVDLLPDEQPTEAIDIDWVCRNSEPQPDLARAAAALKRRYQSGSRVVLVIDEAHAQQRLVIAPLDLNGPPETILLDPRFVRGIAARERA